MRHPIIRVGRDGLPEILDRLSEVLLGVSAVAVAALEVELVSVDVVGRLSVDPGPLGGRQKDDTPASPRGNRNNVCFRKTWKMSPTRPEADGGSREA